MNKLCPICETDELAVRHHIIPVSRKEVTEIVLVCMDCGNQVHMLYTNKELESFGDLDTLLKQPDMVKYVEWKKKHPGDHSYKASKKVREWKAFHR